jgi:hypothetical protein
VQQAVAAVRFTAPPVHDRDAARVLAFCALVDTRPVRTLRRTDHPDRELTPEQVAGYLAKYATKSAADTTTKNTAHLRRLHATTGRLARQAASGPSREQATDPDGPYSLLVKWAPSLGFRGHFATKPRRYSVTLGALRRARQRAHARIAQANRAGARRGHEPSRWRNDKARTPPSLARARGGRGSSRVELRGFEPRAFSLRRHGGP